MTSTLYILPRSPRSKCLVAMCKHLKLDINIVDHSIDSEKFSNLFPLEKTPALIQDDGFQLTEFISIANYFLTISDDRNYSGKNLKDHAQVLRWLSFINHDMIGACSDYIFKSPTPELREKAVQSVDKILTYVDTRLSKFSYIAVDYPTMADDYLCILLEFIPVVTPFTMDKYEHISKWLVEFKKENTADNTLA